MTHPSPQNSPSPSQPLTSTAPAGSPEPATTSPNSPTPDNSGTPTPAPRSPWRPSRIWSRFHAWSQATNWERNAAIIASSAAAVGLIFNAWAIRISDEVAKDQLTHSREQDEDKVQTQAALVNIWEMRDKNFHPLFIVANRSRDPITRLTVGLWLEGSPEKLLEPEQVAFVEVGTSLPPCSRVVIDLRRVFVIYKGDAFDLGNSVAVRDAAISFFDTNAREWERTYGGLKEIKESLPSIPRKRFLAYADKYSHNAPHQAEPLRALLNPLPLSDCVDPST